MTIAGARCALMQSMGGLKRKFAPRDRGATFSTWTQADAAALNGATGGGLSAAECQCSGFSLHLPWRENEDGNISPIFVAKEVAFEAAAAAA